jgi:hypothetical protein
MDDAADDMVDGFPRAAGAPARGAFLAAGYAGLDGLARASAGELLALHGVGPKAIRVVRAALAGRGLALAGETPDTSPGDGTPRD